MNIESILTMSNLKKKFKGFALDIPELKIPKGFSTALIGENGAGKSTLFHIISGTRLDFTGEIDYFQGEKDEKKIREWIGYTSTGGYFMPNWSISQVGNVGSILFDNFDQERYQALLQELAVKEPEGKKKKEKSISKLSDGMRMKVMLASVFARDTRMLLLDEPASPLDPLMRDKLCTMIREYIHQGAGERSVFFSTHNIADMENVTDYAIIMEKGQVVEQGFVEEMKEKYVVVKGESGDAEKASRILFSFQQNSFGFEGICLAKDLDRLAGMDVATEVPNLSQISVAVMKHYTDLRS